MRTFKWQDWDSMAKVDQTVRGIVTPELAEWVLKNRNSHNIHPDAVLVRKYTHAMLDDKWLKNKEVISVRASDGHILNGQKRLMAVQASGKSCETNIGFMVPDDFFKMVDSHGIRRPKHTLQVLGIPNATSISRVVRQVGFILAKIKKVRHTAPSIDGELDAYVALDEQRLQEAWKHVQIFPATFVLNRSVMAALYYCFAEKNKKAADLFFESWFTGMPSRGGPAIVMHKKLPSAVYGSGHDPSHERLVIVVRAWNAYVTHTRVSESDLLIVRGEDIPTILG